VEIIFYTPSYGITDGFGASNFGFAGAEDETALNRVLCPFKLDGQLITGTYEECLRNISDKKWQAGIVCLGNAGNENEFIKKLAAKMRAPLVGGAAAINPITGEKGLITGGGEAAVFLINDGWNKQPTTERRQHLKIRYMP